MGDVKLTVPITEESSIKKIPLWIGFNTESKRDIIYDDLIDSFIAIRMFTETFISDLSTEFGGRTQGNGKTNFGIRRTERTKAVIHWVQENYHISGDTTIIDFN